MSDRSDGTAGDAAPSRASPAHADSTASKYNQRNPAVKRILREMREMAEDASPAYHAEAVEEDIFEWHFAILGAEDSEFEGGIYHGRVLLPPEYPFKPPSFVLLTPSGRFETNTKICLSITQHHPEHWQPSWSVRTALTAVRAFMPSPAEGAVGSLDYTTEERRKLAERSRREVPEFGASPERRELVRRVHAAMMRKWEDSQVSLRNSQNNVSSNAEGTKEKERDDASVEASDDASVDASVADGDGSAAAFGKTATTLPRLAGGSIATNQIETHASDAATLFCGSEEDAPISLKKLTRPADDPSAGPSAEGAREGALGARASPEAERKPFFSEEGADEDEDETKNEARPAPADDAVSASEEGFREPSDFATETTTTARLGASANDATDVPGGGAFLSAEPSPRSARVPVPPRARPLPPIDEKETTPSGRRETSASASADALTASGSVSAGPLRNGPARTAGRPLRRRAEDSPEVTRLKQKLDVAAAFLLFAIAAILARRFLAHVKSGDEF